MNQITVFTPTYNRRHLLPKLYNSLCNQTCNDFIWIVVDDGSSDDTRSLVLNWQKEAIINIHYAYQENAGKMSAHNYAVSISKTELFLNVDSDDYLIDDAIEKILNTWTRLSEKMNLSEINHICGIIAYKGMNKSKPLGNRFPNENPHLTTLNSLYNSGFKGDASVIIRTDILKKHLFPKVPGEKYMRESYIFDQIDQIYTYLLLPQIVMVCEYLEDGYSSNYGLLFKNNPKSCAMYHNQKAQLSIKYCDKAFHTIQYIAYSIYGGNKYIVRDAKKKFLAFMLFAPGLLLYLWRKIRFYNIKSGDTL